MVGNSFIISDHFRDEVRWLLEEKYQWPRDEATRFAHTLSMQPDMVVDKLEDAVVQDISQLLEGVPVAYLIGSVSFLGCKIDLAYRTLIPRPETEYWVEQCLRSLNWSSEGMGRRVLDLCSGSGCISVSVLKYFPQAELLATDIDPQAVLLTRKNIQLLSNHEQKQYNVETAVSDLFTNITGRFDLLLCNPPYVNPDGVFSPELRHEPIHALFAQKNGFALIENVIHEVKNHFLSQSSQLWLEFQYDQADSVINCCESVGLDCRIHQDQFGQHRFAVISTRLASHHQN